MLEIMPVKGTKHQRLICTECNTEFIPKTFAYYASIDGKVCAVCQFTADGYESQILSAVCRNVPDRSRVLYCLSCAVLNFVGACGINGVYLDRSLPLQTAEAMGFRSVGKDGYYTEINGFFNRKCGKNTDI